MIRRLKIIKNSGIELTFVSGWMGTPDGPAACLKLETALIEAVRKDGDQTDTTYHSLVEEELSAGDGSENTVAQRLEGWSAGYMDNIRFAAFPNHAQELPEGWNDPVVNLEPPLREAAEKAFQDHQKAKLGA